MRDKQFKKKKKSKNILNGPESGMAASPALKFPSLILFASYVCFPVSVFLFFSSPRDKDKMVTKGQKSSCHHSIPIIKTSPALSKPRFTVPGEIEDWT